MSTEFDRLITFGQYLVQECGRLQTELNALALNDKVKLPSIKRKAGHLEAYQFVLQRFEELYKGDLESFKKDYLEGYEKENNDDSSEGSDDAGTSGEDE
jgi:hypothetical protein